MRSIAAWLSVVVLGALLAVPGSVAAQGSDGLCDASGVEQFSDVAAGEYGDAYILCARVLELSRGVGGGRFDPSAKLTREQMAAFLARLWRDTLGRECPAEPVHEFGDVAFSFAAADIACLFALGVTKGTSSETYSPLRVLNTSEVTRFVARLVNTAEPGLCDLSGDELAAAGSCLQRLNVAPSVAEAVAFDQTTRAQMAVYLVGAWRLLTSDGLPPRPPSRPSEDPLLKLQRGSSDFSGE